MPPKKKSNKDDNDILTRIAIVNADRLATAGSQVCMHIEFAMALFCESVGASPRSVDRNARKVVLL